MLTSSNSGTGQNRREVENILMIFLLTTILITVVTFLLIISVFRLNLGYTISHGSIFHVVNRLMPVITTRGTLLTNLIRAKLIRFHLISATKLTLISTSILIVVLLMVVKWEVWTLRSIGDILVL